MKVRTKIRMVKEYFLNLSLFIKMFILFALAGLIPLSVNFIVSYKAVYEFSINNQKNRAEQGYKQTLATLSNQLSRVYNMSTLIVANKNLNTSLKIAKDSKDFSRIYTEYKSINSSLINLYYSTEYDSVMYYVNNEFGISESQLPVFRSIETEEGRKVKEKLSANSDKSVWMLYYDERTFNSGEYLSLGRYVMNLSDFNQYIAIFVINIDLIKIRNTFILSRPEELLYIKSKDGELITSSDDQKMINMHLTKEIEQRIGNEFGEIWINGRKYMARRNKIADTNLELISIIPENLTNKVFYDVKKIIIFYLCTCIVMLLIIYAIAKSISKRILLLSEKMKQIQKGSLDKLDLKEQTDEVGNLVISYNYMIDKIKTLLEQQFELGQEKKDAELKALQSQINPHFLYNTLDLINWMAQKNEGENIKETVYALSTYYRLILNKGEDIITIGDEIQLCKAYIAIQQKRFKDRIEFKIDVEENIMMYLLPKITLQPLIENAILHGIVESQSGRGIISISGLEDGDQIVLSVADNGVGMHWGQGIKMPHKGNGYGLYNIEMRLTLFYGMKKCIYYDSAIGSGTCVKLNIGKRMIRNNHIINQ